MKKMVDLLMLLTCSFAQIGYATSNEPFEKAKHLEILTEKTYVNASQIFFSNHSIFIMMDNRLEQVIALNTDSFGIYAERSGYWVCPRCNEKMNWAVGIATIATIHFLLGTTISKIKQA